MRYYLLFVLITCAAYAAASVLAALTAAAAWPIVRRRTGAAEASSRARTLAALRLLPALVGAGVAAATAGAFLRYEPADTTETPGLLLVLAASLTLGLVTSAAWRLHRALAAGTACSRLLRSCGRSMACDDGTRVWVVETDYPVAAVTGIVRTQLLLSKRIIEECTPGELGAVVRHEAAHVRRRDNLVRAAMLYLPDPLAYARIGREMQRAWADAAEESADDTAAGEEPESRAELASALVRVARMADRPAPRWMPALAFYEGTNLERRIGRLLQAGLQSTAGLPAGRIAAILALAGCWALALSDAVARELHVWMELAVTYVP
jgi:Zn-dependent protease with chaperone function